MRIRQVVWRLWCQTLDETKSSTAHDYNVNRCCSKWLVLWFSNIINIDMARWPCLASGGGERSQQGISSGILSNVWWRPTYPVGVRGLTKSNIINFSHLPLSYNNLYRYPTYPTWMPRQLFAKFRWSKASTPLLRQEDSCRPGGVFIRLTYLITFVLLIRIIMSGVFFNWFKIALPNIPIFEHLWSMQAWSKTEAGLHRALASYLCTRFQKTCHVRTAVGGAMD